MKICIVLPSLLGGGAERLHILLAAYWAQNGYEVDFILLQNQEEHGMLNSLVPHAANIQVLGCSRIRKAIFPLKNIFRKKQYDIILSAMWPLTIITIFSNILSRSPAKVVVSDHSNLSLARTAELKVPNIVLRITIGIFYRLAYAIVCVSNGVAKNISFLGAISLKKISVIYNPVCNEGVRPNVSQSYDSLWKTSTKHRLLAVGSLKEQKNFSNLIKAFSLLDPSIQSVSELKILGEGPLRNLLQHQISMQGLEDKIELHGFEIDPSPWFSSAHQFILSSSWEGFGNVLVEALNHGLSIVSTNCESGPSEILENGKHGLLVNVDDSHSLAKGIELALNTQYDKERLFQRSQDFTVEKAGKAYISLFNTL